MSADHGRLAAMVAMTGSAACWGGATVASKSLLETVPALTLLVIQLVASVALLWLMVLVLRVSCNGLTLRRAGTGLLEPGLAYAFSVPGLALTSASSAAVIAATEPMVIALLGSLLLAYRLALRDWAMIMAGVIGVAMLTYSPGGSSVLLGDALVGLGVVCAALYVLASARLVGKVAPLPLAAGQQTVGLCLAVVLLGLAVASGAEALVQVPPATLLAAAAVGMVQYGLAFWLYLTGMRSLSTTTAAQFLTLTPVFGVVGAIVFLNETQTMLQLAGACVVVAALCATRTGA